MGKRRVARSQPKPAPASRSQWKFWAIAGAVLVLVGGILGYLFWQQPGLAKIGEPAPDFTLRLLSGGTLRLSSLKGKPVVLNFWNST
jgi:cytochrome oxidase Cu insertion factor (SCO1/SenC/PrrC family)